MYEQLLMDSGLTQNEVKVYISLLRSGKSKSGKIVKESGISGGKVYETLDKLIEKGLVEVVIDNGVKHFSAAEPESILQYMEERKNKIVEQTQKLASVVPDLKKLKEFTEPVENVYLIKGFRGIGPIVYDALNAAKSEIKVMGIRASKDEKYNTFWRHWHRERVRLKKKARVLFTVREKKTEYCTFFEKLSFTHVKQTPNLSPSAIMVIDNNSFIFSYESGFMCIHIKSEAISKSFSSFFEDIWEMAKK